MAKVVPYCFSLMTYEEKTNQSNSDCHRSQQCLMSTKYSDSSLYCCSSTLWPLTPRRRKATPRTTKLSELCTPIDHCATITSGSMSPLWQTLLKPSTTGGHHDCDDLHQHQHHHHHHRYDHHQHHHQHQRSAFSCS